MRGLVLLLGAVAAVGGLFGLVGHPRVKAWLYRGGRPNRAARAFGAFWATVGRLGVVPSIIVALEVRGLRGASAGCRAVLLRGSRQEVTLVEVPAPERAPILKAYLGVAAGARGHIPVEPGAPLAAFEAVAPGFPVFRIEPIPPFEPA